MTDAWILRDGLPIWLAALCLAAIAPWCVRIFASSVERRTLQRTRRVTSSISRSVEVPDNEG